MATKLVESEVYKNILIITADKVYDEYARLNNFALLSDSAASCLVVSGDVSGYKLLSESFRSSEEPITSNKGKDDSELYQRVLTEVLDRSDLGLKDIKAVMCSNVFKPVTQQKERKLGFEKTQLYQNNVSRYGHCFSADTLINLVDYRNEVDTAEHDVFMLSADAPNLRASVILKPIH